MNFHIKSNCSTKWQQALSNTPELSLPSSRMQLSEEFSIFLEGPIFSSFLFEYLFAVPLQKQNVLCLVL